MFENVFEDIRMYTDQYKNIGLLKKTFYLAFTQELHAVLIYRFGRWAQCEFQLPVLSHIFRIIYFFLRKASEIFIGVGIWPESEIGPGLKVEHYGGVYIKAKMGKKCRISQQVIIGHVGGFKGGGVPTLGDNVYVGAGAKILGEISIGDNAKIGANAVVLCDVPDNGVAVGVPARVVKVTS
jgi:serine O-acetyltransferase